MIFAIIALSVLGYILVGFGYAKYRIIHPDDYKKWDAYRAVLLWPIELGGLIAKARNHFDGIDSFDERLVEMYGPHKLDRDVNTILYDIFDIKNLLKKQLNNISDVITVNNPPWGSESASERKKANLISMYADHLVKSAKISIEQASVKATFIINNFGTDAILHDFKNNNGGISEHALRISNFFIKEIEKKAKNLTPPDLYQPLFTAVAIKKWDKIRQNTGRAFKAYSAKNGYDRFIEDAAIIYRLENLNLLRKSENSAPTYKIVETDISKIRQLILGNLYDELHYEHFEGECTKFVEDDLPFIRSM